MLPSAALLAVLEGRGGKRREGRGRREKGKERGKVRPQGLTEMTTLHIS